MSKTKVFLVTILGVLFLFASFASAQAVTHVTINDIREEVKDGWHQTDEAHGRTIVVGVDIDIPDVTTVPILRVGFPPALTANDETGESYPNRAGIGRVVVSRPGVYEGDGDSYEITGLDARAEDNPLSMQEAWEAFHEILVPYIEQTGPLDLFQQREVAKSKTYKRVSRQHGGLADFDLNNPTAEMGIYSLTYGQMFHGIPYYLVVSYKPEAYPSKVQMDIPDSCISIEIATKDDYKLMFYPTIEVGVLADDTALVPFAEVKKEFEKAIKAGHIREVYDIRLMYHLYIDPENPGEYYVLQPIWVMRGVMAEKASFPDPRPIPLIEEYYRKYLGETAIVEAFSGETMGDRPKWEYADLKLWK